METCALSPRRSTSWPGKPPRIAKPAAKAAARKPAKKAAKARRAQGGCRGARRSSRPRGAVVRRQDRRRRMPGMGDMSKMAKMMTPEQAIDMYKANAKIALDIINAAIEGTAKVRRLQFEGEEQARAMGRKAARHAAEAGSPDALMAAGQSVVAGSRRTARCAYWGQMFELVVEIQKRLFTLMEGADGRRAWRQGSEGRDGDDAGPAAAQNVIEAMQGVISSGGNAFESMQKVMGDFAKFMPGQRR